MGFGSGNSGNMGASPTSPVVTSTARTSGVWSHHACGHSPAPPALMRCSAARQSPPAAMGGDQEVPRAGSATIRQPHVQRFPTAARGADVRERPVRSAQSGPTSRRRLRTRPVVGPSGIPNSPFRVGHVRIAASLKCRRRPRLPPGGGTRSISGSNRIGSDPRRPEPSLQDDQFGVLYSGGTQRLLPRGHHAGFMR